MSPAVVYASYALVLLVAVVLVSRLAPARQRSRVLWVGLTLVLGPLVLAALLALPQGGYRAAALRERAARRQD